VGCLGIEHQHLIQLKQPNNYTHTTNNTSTNNTTTQQHNNTTTQQHNNTTTQNTNTKHKPQKKTTTKRPVERLKTVMQHAVRSDGSSPYRHTWHCAQQLVKEGGNV
jgi:hypothetical protein